MLDSHDEVSLTGLTFLTAQGSHDCPEKSWGTWPGLITQLYNYEPNQLIYVQQVQVCLTRALLGLVRPLPPAPPDGPPRCRECVLPFSGEST